MQKLTGRTRFRPYVTDNGVMLVLQVEFTGVIVTSLYAGQVLDWRDATVEDLCEIQHLTYGHVHLSANIKLPDTSETLPGEEASGARKLH